MVGKPQTHFLNADFDLGLRPRPLSKDRPAIRQQVRELSLQALLGADPGDAALLPAPVPEEFLDYLESLGLTVPTILLRPTVAPETTLRPFGWSTEAMELNHLHSLHVDHPSPATVERVNRRSYSRQIEEELSPAESEATVLEDPEELKRFLARTGADTEWIVKAEHGNSGLANRRFRTSVFSDEDRSFVSGMFAEDDRAVIEPWRHRERDWCVVFEVPFSDSSLRIHEMVNTRDGALIGALFEPGPSVYQEELGAMAETVATRLQADGYIGPVCVDAFEWRDTDRLRLRSLVDLNCRRSMSDRAHRLWCRLAPEQTSYYRFFSRRKLRLPGSFASAVKALEGNAYTRSRGQGVLLASPLAFGEGDQETTRRLAVIFVAEDRNGIFGLESWFRTRFEA